MDIIHVISLVTITEQCLSAYAFGHIRTSNIMSYIKPTVHQTSEDTHSDLQSYPALYRIWKKSSSQQQTDNQPSIKQLFAAFPKYKTRKYASTPDQIQKRFFQYSPFVINRNDKINPFSPYKSTLIDDDVGTVHVKPYVGSFSGVGSWAQSYFRTKQTDPQTTGITEGSDRRPDESAQAKLLSTNGLNKNNTHILSDGKEDRAQKLATVKEMVNIMASKAIDNKDKDQTETSFTDNEDGKMKTELVSGSETGMDELNRFLKMPSNLPGDDTVSRLHGDSSLPFSQQLALETRNSYAHHGETASETLTHSGQSIKETDSKFRNQKTMDTDGVPVFNYGAMFADSNAHAIDEVDSFDEFQPYVDGVEHFPEASLDYASHSFGTFEPDTNNCKEIETKSCVQDSECNCYGVYTCLEQRCQITSSADWFGDDNDFADVDGDDDWIVWLDGPVDISDS